MYDQIIDWKGCSLNNPYEWGWHLFEGKCLPMLTDQPAGASELLVICCNCKKTSLVRNVDSIVVIIVVNVKVKVVPMHSFLNCLKTMVNKVIEINVGLTKPKPYIYVGLTKQTPYVFVINEKMFVESGKLMYNCGRIDKSKQ